MSDFILKYTNDQPVIKFTNNQYLLKVGAPGPQGAQGSGEAVMGPQGPEGPQGPAGIDGEDGVDGLPGIQGPKGDTGSQGIQGIQGIKGDTGLTGAKGDKGDIGLQGIQGIQGIQGDTGLQGPIGLTGPKGDKGDQGIQGIQGLQGPQGIQGEPGTSTDAWTYVVATTDTANSTVTAVNAAGLSVSGLANGLYEIEAVVLGTTAAVGTGIQIGIAYPTSAPVAAFIWGVGASGSAQVFRSVATDETGAHAVALGASRVTPAINVAAYIKGTVRATSMTGAIAITVRSEVAASEVKAKADSYIRYRKVAN